MGERVGSSINQLSPRISTRSLNVSWLGDFGHVAYFVCKFGILPSPSGRLVANGLDGRPRRRRLLRRGRVCEVKVEFRGQSPAETTLKPSRVAATGVLTQTVPVTIGRPAAAEP
jgi:hypothetical protein